MRSSRLNNFQLSRNQVDPEETLTVPVLYSIELRQLFPGACRLRQLPHYYCFCGPCTVNLGVILASLLHFVTINIHGIHHHYNSHCGRCTAPLLYTLHIAHTRRRFTAALITTIVREQHPRSHHKGAIRLHQQQTHPAVS